MAITVRIKRPSRGPNWQLRAQQLEEELLAERGQHEADVLEMRQDLATATAALARREAEAMVLERANAGLQEQLAEARRELERFLRAHGLGHLIKP